MSLAHQVAILYVGGQGHLDELPLAQVRPFETAFHRFLEERYPDVLHEIEKTKDLPEVIAKRLGDAAAQCKEAFLAAARG